MRLGSLFSGYGGLDMGVQAAIGGTVAWHCDNDPGASKILAHRHPDVPNLGDITAVDWAAVEPVDVLTGGFPCQDVSHAGKRVGMTPDSRSGMWTHMAYAIAQLRPALVVAENVRGLLSAHATSDLELCPWCLGDAGPSPLRALGAVLGDLAQLGYMGGWHGLRAADVGAPHGRFRVFVVASDTDGQGRARGRQVGRRRPEPADGVAAPDAHDSQPDQPEGTDRPTNVRGQQGWTEQGARGRPAADAGGERHGRGQDAGRVGPVDGEDAGRARQRERAREVIVDRGAPAAAIADGDGLEGVGRVDTLGRDTDRCGGQDVAWGDYEPAIRRWEHTLGRPAPAPTEPGRNGAPRLSARFVEWLMGLPDGWVTDVPDLTRNAQLKALGNGVVPAQAEAALRHLLAERVA